jgi:gliding motility-associated-like protein
MVATNCAPVATSFCCQFGIAQVAFAGINQSSGDASEGYRDFTCGTIGSAAIGSSQPITITNSGGNVENVGVWVDWNNDGSFSDAELAFSSTGSTTHAGNITIPGNAPAGLGLRVRVKSDISAQPVGSACGSIQSGQVEDYQIILQGNNQPPIALFTGSNQITCDGIISFSDTSFNAPTSWKWKFGDGGVSKQINPTHVYNNDGLYSVSLKLVSPIGCSTDTLFKNLILVKPTPKAAFVIDPPEVSNVFPDFKLVDQSKDAVSWLWQFGDGREYTDHNPIASAPELGTLSITQFAYNNFGCQDSVVKILKTYPEVRYFLPNAFTPNGDSVNDELRAVGVFEGMRSFNINVWNRWGEMVYQSINPEETWNGQKFNQGIPLPVGIYTVLVTYLNPKEERKEYRGFVTLIR